MGIVFFLQFCVFGWEVTTEPQFLPNILMTISSFLSLSSCLLGGLVPLPALFSHAADSICSKLSTQEVPVRDGETGVLLSGTGPLYTELAAYA